MFGCPSRSLWPCWAHASRYVASCSRPILLYYYGLGITLFDLFVAMLGPSIAVCGWLRVRGSLFIPVSSDNYIITPLRYSHPLSRSLMHTAPGASIPRYLPQHQLSVSRAGVALGLGVYPRSTDHQPHSPHDGQRRRPAVQWIDTNGWSGRVRGYLCRSHSLTYSRTHYLQTNTISQADKSQLNSKLFIRLKRQKMC